MNEEFLLSDNQIFSGQFLLTSRGTRIPVGYRSFTRCGWNLATDLPTVEIFGADASFIGWIIGWASGPEGKILTESVRISDDATPLAIEEFIYRHGGRFAAIILTASCQRLYLDSAGSLAAVYARHGESFPGGPVAASTTSLLAWSEECETDRSEPAVNSYWPAGLTADPRCRRLLPNHYLDLSSWGPVRHHLSRTLERVGADEVEPLIQDILQHLSLNVSAACQWADVPPAFGLTAGQDSRMILAASRPVAQNLDVFTFDYRYMQGDPDGTNADRYAARTLARRLGLRHRVLPISDTGPEIRAEYLHRIGYAGNSGKARDFLQACRTYLDPRQPLITGFGGAVGRTLYWKKLAHLPGAGTAEMILQKLKLPADEGPVQAMQSWLESFEYEDLESLLNMLYLEQRHGCWAGPHAYGFANVFSMSAFTHRRIFDAMLRLPVEYRRSQRLAEDVVRIGWPELAGIPFGSKIDWYSTFRRKLSAWKTRLSH
jgi:hypothetical protein